jgi:hypothetical protein
MSTGPITPRQPSLKAYTIQAQVVLGKLTTACVGLHTALEIAIHVTEQIAVPTEEVANGTQLVTCHHVENTTAVALVEGKEHYGEGYYSDVLQEHSQQTSVNMQPSSSEQTTWSNRSIE